MLALANKQAPERVSNQCIALIGQADFDADERREILHHVFELMSRSSGLLALGIWTIGEFGQVLLQPAQDYEAKSESQVVDLMVQLQSDMEVLDVSEQTKAMLLNACLKLSVRFGLSKAHKLMKVVGTYSTSMSLELQARSCEYSNLIKHYQDPGEEEEEEEKEEGGESNLLGLMDEEEGGETEEAEPGGDEDKRAAFRVLLAPMPVPTMEAMRERRLFHEQARLEESGSSSEEEEEEEESSSEEEEEQKPDLLDMDSIFTKEASSEEEEEEETSVLGFQNADLRISFTCEDNPKGATLTATYESPFDLSGFTFAAAVPKYLKMKLGTASGTEVAKGAPVSQKIKVLNSKKGEKPIMLKIKVTYVKEGQEFEVQATAKDFPLGL